MNACMTVRQLLSSKSWLDMMCEIIFVRKNLQLNKRQNWHSIELTMRCSQ